MLSFLPDRTLEELDEMNARIPATAGIISLTIFAVTMLARAALAQRIVPTPLYGVTLDDVSNASAETNMLAHIARTPTVRVVFDKGTTPSYYRGSIQAFRPVSYIMGELIDSSYMKQFGTVSAVRSWATNYVNILGPLVDIWEVGNEVNGDWLGGNVIAKIAAMYDTVAAKGYKTALTFFYEGEASEPGNCIDSQGGMFPWIQRNFLSTPTSETEKIRLGLNFALISWYPDQCPGEEPDWAVVYTMLANIFPNARVGFGEIGTANPQGGSAYEKNEISTYYPLGRTLAGLPSSYIGGYFWWYAAEEMVPWPGSLGDTLNTALAGP
jgi:hypothetical protein